MAEEFSSKVSFPGLNQASDEWKKLGQEIKGAVNEADSDGFVDLADAFNIATEAAGKLFTAAGEIISGLKEMSTEMERVAGIANRFNGNVDEAAKRTNGLVTELDLMIASNTAAAAGLDLTAEQFANISVAATEIASSVGGDATEAINKLARAIALGEEGALREFNISLGEAKTQAERQTAALASLAEQYGDMESSADTLGGRIAVLENRLEDTKNEFIATLNETGALEEAFDSLSDAVSSVGDALGLSFGDGGAGIREWAIVTGAVIEATAAQFTALIDTVVAAGEAVKAFVTQDIAGAAAALDRAVSAQEGIGFAAFDATVDREAREGAGNVLRRQAERDAARSAAGANRGGRGGGSAGESTEKEKLLELTRRELDLEEELLANAEAKADAEARLLSFLEDQARAKERIAEASALESSILEKQIEQERALQEELTQRQKKAGRIQDELDSLDERRNSITEKSAEGFRGILDIGFETARLVKESNASIGQAFKTAIDEWLKGFALQEAYKGVAALAEGIGSTITNQPNAAAKFAEAGIHFALAAAAGGASLAIPNSGGGGGGAARPEATGGGNSGGGGGGGTTVININNPVSRSEAGKEQARADRAHKRRNG